MSRESNIIYIKLENFEAIREATSSLYLKKCKFGWENKKNLYRDVTFSLVFLLIPLRDL